MEPISLQIVNRVLHHASIVSCFIGELALQYYNVPRVVHLLEICVSGEDSEKAVSALTATGLFAVEETTEEFNNYTEYQRGVPKLRSTEWVEPPFTVIIFDDTSQSLNPLSENVVADAKIRSCTDFSRELSDYVPPRSIALLPWPRLPALLTGLCKRYLEHADDIAMIGAEQLVDGMDVDEDWCATCLAQAPPSVSKLVARLVAGKKSRLDPFAGNQITCYVSNEEEVKSLRALPGYR